MASVPLVITSSFPIVIDTLLTLPFVVKVSIGPFVTFDISFGSLVTVVMSNLFRAEVCSSLVAGETSSSLILSRVTFCLLEIDVSSFSLATVVFSVLIVTEVLSGLLVTVVKTSSGLFCGGGLSVPYFFCNIQEAPSFS